MNASRGPALAYVALGSNLGDSFVILERALRALARFGRVVAQSAIYLTPPLGPPQPDYLNAVAALETTLDPTRLLSALKALERELGRLPGERWAPRHLDLDLLFHGEELLDGPLLKLPHPELPHRAFVLVPLAEIAAHLRHPLLKRSMAELLADLPLADRAAIRRVDSPPGSR